MNLKLLPPYRLKLRLIAFILLSHALLFVAADTFAAEDSIRLKTSFAYYYDNREFTTAAVNLSANNLPMNFSLWGFTDFHGDHGSASLSSTRYFSEYRLSHSGIGRWLSTPGLGLQVEYNGIKGDGNDVSRAGVTYKHGLPLPWAGRNGWLQWRAFPYETDNDGGQLSVVFFVPVTNRVVVSGFADYNVSENGSNQWVIEPGVTVRVTDKLKALLEVRYNGFEDDNPAVRGTGVALGMRYDF